MKTIFKVSLVMIVAALAVSGCRKNKVDAPVEAFDPAVDGVSVQPLNIPDEQLANRIVSNNKAISYADDRITEKVSAPTAEGNLSGGADGMGMGTPAGGDQPAVNNDPNSF